MKHDVVKYVSTSILSFEMPHAFLNVFSQTAISKEKERGWFNLM